MGGASRFVTLLSSSPLRPTFLHRLPFRHHHPSSHFPTLSPLKSSSSPLHTHPIIPTPNTTTTNYTPPISLSHPWPEWSLLINFLQPHGFPTTPDDQTPVLDSFMLYEQNELDSEFVGSASVLLAFAANNPQLLGMVSRKDVEVVVTNGTPFLFKGALHTARRMRAFLAGNGGNALGADNANTVDLMKYILSYASDPAVPSSVSSIYSRELVESSVRNLLHELAVLNGVTPSSDQPVEDQTRFQDNYGQTSTPHTQNIVMKRGDWICSKCSFMNFARNTQCLECEEYRPKKLLTGAEWECPQCDFLNYGRNTICLRCDCKRPGPVSTNPVNSKPASGYNGKYANPSSTNSMPSQVNNASDLSSTINEDFPEIMPLRRGENRFVVSTRKTPLERRQTNTSKDIAPGPESAGKTNVDALVQRSLDRILGRTSASSHPENGEPTVLFPKIGVSEASSIYDSGEVEKFQHSENSENMDNVNNKNKDQEENSGRLFKRMDEQHNVKDLSSAVSEEDFQDIMPVRKGVNRFVVSKKKDRSPTEKRNMASVQASSSKYVPFVPFPPGYFAKTEPQPPEGSISPANAAETQPPEGSISPANTAENGITGSQVTQRSAGMDNSRINKDGAGSIISSQVSQRSAGMDNSGINKDGAGSIKSSQVSQRSAGMDDSRINKDGAGSIKRTENDQISSASNIISAHQEMSSNSYASRITYPENSAQSLPRTDLLKDASLNYAGATHGQVSKTKSITHPTNATADSLHPPLNQNTQSGWNGKSLEGSAVKEPDQLDMSEEAKAERWFKRVAQIKDISELSQIPDEDFPSIMPMRKGVNRFVVSKRKTPMERRLTSSQYRRNLPVETYDPSRKDNNSGETK